MNKSENDYKKITPNKRLREFITQYIEINEKKESLKVRGQEITDNDKQTLKNLSRKKVDILDTVVFPALADLTYFFEATAANPTMEKAFRKDLIEILDTRKGEHIINVGGSSALKWPLFKRNNFARLVRAALNIGHNPNVAELDDFRLMIMYHIMETIGDRMGRIISFHRRNMHDMYMEDYKRMRTWFAMMGESAVNPEDKGRYSRMLGFKETKKDGTLIDEDGWD